jgi:hypothetical protein
MTSDIGRRRFGVALAAAMAALVISCAPRAGSLRGDVVPAIFPRAELPPGHRRIIFRWDYADQALGAKGEGVVRVAPPDSARLDFFLDGGLGGGFAILVGDSITTPGGDAVRRYLPPPTLLWAALGRLAVPPAEDTVAMVDDGILRADIGRDPRWRVSFVGDRLVRLDRIVDGRRLEWVSRDTADVRYENERSARRLALKITKTDNVPAFDPSIWRR